MKRCGETGAAATQSTLTLARDVGQKGSIPMVVFERLHIMFSYMSSSTSLVEALSQKGSEALNDLDIADPVVIAYCEASAVFRQEAKQ